MFQSNIVNDEDEKKGYGEFIGIFILILFLEFVGQYSLALWMTRILLGYIVIVLIYILKWLRNLPKKTVHNDDWYLGAKDIEMKRPLTQHEYSKEENVLNRELIKGILYFGATLLLYHFLK
jgi:hypothetical protein